MTLFALLVSGKLHARSATLLCVCMTFISNAQPGPDTEIAFTFDHHTFNEDHHLLTAKPVGVSLVEDRFGNDRSAVGLNGHVNSYLSLGVSPLLQPKKTTISLWIRMNGRTYAGRGAESNPILLIKNGPVNDWYTAYGIGFNGQMSTFVAVSSKDSTDEAILSGVNRVEFGKWYHLVMTSDNRSFAFYIDGKLQGRCKKDFETQFLATDSMMIGHTANKKNERYTSGIVDDIRIFHRVLNEDEIQTLYEAPNPNRAALILDEVIYWCSIAGGIFVVAFLLVWQRRRKLKRVSERLDVNRRLHEMEVRTLKAQMNPHFIFNALNSIQTFIVHAENDKAEAYLSKFSKLLRELLETNTNESLSVKEETAILSKYLEIESLRFGQSFSYSLKVDETIDSEDIRIPHMMLQPFVENAIWHGLLMKDGDRQLEVTMEYASEKTIRGIIDDNGVGREKSAGKEHTMKRKSLALSMVRQRLELMNSLLNVDCSIEIIDKTPAFHGSFGTRVIVTLPII